MTTVVVNRKCIAADRQLLIKGDAGGTHFVDGPKLTMSACGTFAYASTGIDLSKRQMVELEELFRKITRHFTMGGALSDKEFTNLATAVHSRVVKPTLILTRNMFISVLDGLIAISDEHVDFVSIGTGGSFAASAMVAGRTPKQAVEFACLHDTLSGYGVDVIHANKLKAIKVG